MVKKLTIALAAACVAAFPAEARIVEKNWHVFSRSCAIGAGAQESITYAFSDKRWIYVISEH